MCFGAIIKKRIMLYGCVILGVDVGKVEILFLAAFRNDSVHLLKVGEGKLGQHSHPNLPSPIL